MAARRRRCGFCSEPLPKDARPNRKFCNDDCRRGRAKPDPTAPLGPVAQATEKSIAAATHLTDMDAGAVETLRTLARKIDWIVPLDERREKATGDEDQAPMPLDNVTIPTYLKFCESLGLTVAGRSKFEDKPKEGSGGKLAQLRSVAAGGRSA